MAGRRDQPLWVAPRAIRYLALIEPETVVDLKHRLDQVSQNRDTTIAWYRDRQSGQLWKCTESMVESWLTETLEPVAIIEKEPKDEDFGEKIALQPEIRDQSATNVLYSLFQRRVEGAVLGEGPTSASDLVDLVYASTIDPQRYDDLMTSWQVHLDAVLSVSDPEMHPEPAIAADDDEIERHFNRAFAILERLGRQGTETLSLGALVEGESRPAVLLDPSGRIVAVNSRASEEFDVSSGDSVSALSLEATGLSNIRQALVRMAEEPAGRLLTVTRILSPRDGTTPIVALNRAASVDPKCPLALLSVADIAWSERIGEILRQVFALTTAECEIARGIIGGLSIEQLAAARGRSEQTVKTQSKSVLRKLELRTQAELIRMVAALMQMDSAPELLRTKGVAGSSSRTTLMRAKGRLLDVVTMGPDGGRPVLFIHGMLDGHGATEVLRKGLMKRNIRFICPVRPNFGNSGPDGGVRDAPLRFAADLEAVMDHFGVSACPVIGHIAGAVYAFAAAARLGSRISHVINIAGGVPIVSTSQFATMSTRQRIVAHTARFTPGLLPLILRAGIALLDSGGDRAFMNALYRSAPLDYRVATTPEVFALLREGYRFTVTQGHRAFEIDSGHVVRDWSEYAEGSTQPILLVHGTHDPVVDIATVHAFAERLGDRAQVIEYADQGQLMFYSAPERILDVLEAALATPLH